MQYREGETAGLGFVVLTFILRSFFLHIYITYILYVCCNWMSTLLFLKFDGTAAEVPPVRLSLRLCLHLLLLLLLRTQVFEPVEHEAERKAVTVWAEAEARTFVEKFLMYPKNFEKIAACLDGKTTRDCVVSTKL